MSEGQVTEYLQLKGEAGDLLADLGSSLITLVEGAPDDGEAHRAIDEQLQSFWGRFYSLKKRWNKEQLSVAVLALTKSGKSTLINAFLGNEILPVNNVPETARISRIEHAPSCDCPEPTLEVKSAADAASGSSSDSPRAFGLAGASALAGAAAAAEDCDLARLLSSDSSGSTAEGAGDNKLRGAEQIREHLQQLNRDARSREHLRSDDQVLKITAPLVVLDQASRQGYGGIKLCLLDTPGPNEAGEEGLKYQVERLLDRVDAAIYLLDYTKLKTAEEAQVLERLKAINPGLVGRLSSRLFFAVNKIDQAEQSCGLGEEETREYVADLVTRQLNCPDFRLHPDQVLLLSARNALLSRLVLAGRADAANSQRFARVAFGSFNPRTASNRSSELVRTAAEDMLQGSGVPELEERVLGFLFEAAAGLKLVAVLDDMGRLMNEVSNVAASCRGALAASSAVLDASRCALQGELQATLGQFDAVMEGTGELQVEVVDELRAHLGNLRTRLFQFICSSLDTDALAGREQATAAAAAEAGEAGSSQHHRRQHRGGCCHHRHRHHHRHRSQHYHDSAAASATSSSSFSSAAFGADASSCHAAAEDAADAPDCDAAAASGDGPAAAIAAAAAAAATAAAGAAGAARGWWRLRQRFLRMFGSWMGGAGGGGCRSKDELSSALIDLSEDIMAQVQSEVTDTWAVMERATNARARRLVDGLNGALEGLAGRLEGVVNEGLQVRLEPVSLSMAPPDAVAFHGDLSALIEAGIAEEQARHIRASERTEMVWEARRGVCRLTQYYVQVPRRRRIVETYTATTYSLVPSAVAEHFMGVVDKAISETERALAGYVREYVRRQVEAARHMVQEYGDRYLDSMGAALEAASRGADARAAALAQAEAYCAGLEGLRGRLGALQARAERLVPHNSGSGCGVFEQVEYEPLSEEDDEAEQQGQQQQQDEQETEQLHSARAVDAQHAAAEAEQQRQGDQLRGGIEGYEPIEQEEEQQQQGEEHQGAGEQQSEDALEAAVEGAGAGSAALAVGAAAAAAVAGMGDASTDEALDAEPASAAEVQGPLQEQLLEMPTESLEPGAAPTPDGEDGIDAGLEAGDDDVMLQELLQTVGEASGQQQQGAAAATAADATEESHQSELAAAQVEVAPAAVQDAEQQQEAEAEDAAAKAVSRVGSSSSIGSSSSGQLVTAAEVQEAQQAEAAAAGVLLMRSLPQQQQQQQQQQDVDAAEQQQSAEGAVEASGQGSEAAGTATDSEVAGAADAAAVADAEGHLLETQTAAYDAGGDAAVAAMSEVTAADIFGGLPVVRAADVIDLTADGDDDEQRPAAAASSDAAAGFLLDVDAIEGARVLQDVPVAAVAPAAPAALLPAVAVAAAADDAAPPAAEGAAASHAGAASPTGSSASNAETPLSGMSSMLSAAGTDSSAFSGMTAGTAFTLSSHTTQGSGYSRAQERLANSVLGGSALLAAGTATESGAAEVATSNVDSTAGASAETTPAAVASSSNEAHSDHRSTATPAPVSASAFAAAAATEPEEQQQPLDTCLYASIIAHNDDAPHADGSPGGDSPFDFQQSFAAALSAAGLDGLAAAPSASVDSGSEEWCLVDGADVENGGPAAATAR